MKLATLGHAAAVAIAGSGLAVAFEPYPVNDTLRARQPRRRERKKQDAPQGPQSGPVIQVRSLRSVGGYSKGQLKRSSYEIGIVAMFARARLQEQQRRLDRRTQRQAAALDQAAKDGVF